MSAWISRWKVPPDVTLVASHGDYRDQLPLRPEVVAEQLASVVKVRPNWLFTAICPRHRGIE
jgi:hypothetical protein